MRYSLYATHQFTQAPHEAVWYRRIQDVKYAYKMNLGEYHRGIGIGAGLHLLLSIILGRRYVWSRLEVALRGVDPSPVVNYSPYGPNTR